MITDDELRTWRKLVLALAEAGNKDYAIHLNLLRYTTMLAAKERDTGKPAFA